MRRSRAAAGGRTAFIDLMFILLAFVVVVSGVRQGRPEERRNRELSLELPVVDSSSAHASPPGTRPLGILLREDGRVFVDGSRIPVADDRAFRAAVRHAIPPGAGETVVRIDADARTPLEAALRVVELLRAEGLHRILFLATGPLGKREG